jgi:hypothetical protein
MAVGLSSLDKPFAPDYRLKDLILSSLLSILARGIVETTTDQPSIVRREE